MADAPFTPSDYTDLITSEHRGKPKFVATVESTVDPAVNAQDFLKELPAAFDLDSAIGVQLDAVGAWVGISRTITTCLITAWFSFDVEGLGFDQGIWKGPYDPDRGLYELDDDTYRALIRLKIAVNTWDGTIETARAAIMDFYAQTESYPFILDNQDMHMVVCISGKRPIMVTFAIYAGRYVEFKPAGVTMHTVVPSVEYTPAFGYDADSNYVGGFDVGSWVVEADSVLCSGDSEYETTLARFDPRYWTIDLPLTASAALVTTGTSGLTLYATLRAESDLVGLKWQSEDKWSHRGFGYYTSPNYTSCILDFDFTLTGLDGSTSGSPSDMAGLTMTVTDDEGVPYYIRLANYLTSGTINSGHIKLDFSGAPVLGGFNPDDATQRVIIPWHRIVEFSIGFAPSTYDKDSSSPLSAKIDVVFSVTNLSVSGENMTMIQRLVATPSHNVRMCDGGDDAYPLTPERIVTGLQQLGYSGQYVIYIGASHLHELTWDAGAGSFLVDPSQPVSTPMRMWYQDLFTRLVEAGYDPVISQSYEIFAAMCPEAWQQRDYTGAGARTGWEPPSTLIAPTVTDAMDYLKSVALWMCGTLAASGGNVRYQVGEPWWWDGSYTDGGPCIYDDTTTALYVSETGNAVPTPYLTSITESVGIHGAYLDWLSGKLGASTLWLRDQVKAIHTDATTYILLFTPQILSPTSEIVTRLNLPVSSWQSPAFDVLQLEDYDWIIDGDWENHARTLSAGTDTLGYALGNIQYFGGFNLLASTASTIWPRITLVINEALAWGIQDVCVWARPQVWRDGWIPITGRLVGELGDSADAGPDPITWVFPTDLDMVANTWGDIVLSFAPNQDTEGHIYTIEILDGTTVKRTITVDSPDIVSGRVLVDYTVEESAPDWGFPPTYLKWQVRVDGGTVKTVMNDNVTVNNVGLVKKAIAFAGQSNALGHFTTLSGTDARKDLVSAGHLRRQVASDLGLKASEVIPVQMAWGSSAADKLADDDPVAGVNYWWDLDAGEAGPRMTEAISIIDGLGVELAAIIWAQGENDAGAMDPSAAPRSSTPARYTSATLAIFQALREAAGNPNLPIWFQTIGRGWWGDPPDVPESGGVYYKSVRDAQVSITLADPNVFIGSWVPGSETIDGYVQEETNVGWVHYTSDVYHATALELAEAISTPLDRITSRPAWTLMSAPTLTPSVNVYDVTITWPATNGATYIVTNLNVISGATISTTTVIGASSMGTWTFTTAEQVAEYGYAGGWVNVTVYELQGDIKGPAAQATFDPSTLSGAIATPTGLDVAHGTGWDLVYSWDTEDGASYIVTNRDVTDNTAISAVTVTASGTTASWTFTGASQITVYGFPAAYVYFDVRRVYDGTPGPAASLTKEVATISGGVTAPTGLSAAWAESGAWDIVLTWDAVAGRTYRVVNRDVTNSAVLTTVDVTATGSTASWTFTGAAQTTAYSSHARYIDADVSEVWDDYPGPVSTMIYDMWSPLQIDGTDFSLWLDMVRQQSIISASETTVDAHLPRTGDAKVVVGSDGSATTVASNTVAYDYSSGQRRMLLEGTATNLFYPSAAPSAAVSLTVTAQSYTVSFWGTGSLVLSDAYSSTVTGAGASVRTTYTFTPAAGTLTLTPSGTVTNVQVETGGFATSYIATTTAAVTRTTDVCTWSSGATALLSTAGPNTIALRGKLSLAAASKGVIFVPAGGMLYVTARNTSSGYMRFYGGTTYITLGIVPLGLGTPINEGFCAGWDASGRIGSQNGATPVTDGTVLTYSMSSVFFGRSTGMDSGTRFDLDELLIWPAKGSSTAVQSQARVWE